MASWVELPPTPAITGTRPAACSTDTLMICACSSTSTVGDSPEVPTTTNASVPSATRSEEHTSELQSLMRISYAVFCLNKKTKKNRNTHATNTATNTTAE